MYAEPRCPYRFHSRQTGGRHTTPELFVRQLGGRGGLRGVRGRRRGGERGPVALRPRLSPGVPLSWDVL